MTSRGPLTMSGPLSTVLAYAMVLLLSRSSSTYRDSGVGGLVGVDAGEIPDVDAVISMSPSSSSSSASDVDVVAAVASSPDHGRNGGSDMRDRPYVIFAHTFNCDDEEEGNRRRRRRRRRASKAGKACKSQKSDKSVSSSDGSNGEVEIEIGEVAAPTPSPVETIGEDASPTPSPVDATSSRPVAADVDDDDDPLVAACDALAGGMSPSSSTAGGATSLTMSYVYELSIASGSDVGTVVDAMEDALSLYVGGNSMGCDEHAGGTTTTTTTTRWKRWRRRRMDDGGYSGTVTSSTNETSTSGGGSSVAIAPPSSTTTVVGASNDPADVASDDASCQYFVGERAIDSSSCLVVDGGMTLFFSDGTSTEDESNSVLGALEIMMEAMNSIDPSPFLGGSGGAYGVPNVVGVRFIRGDASEGGSPVEGGDGISYDDDDSETPIEQIDASAATAASQGPSSNISTLGGVIMGFGILVLLALTLLTVRRVRSSTADERFREFKNEEGDGRDEDVNDDDFEGTDVDAASLASSPRKKRAYIVGEEGSVRTHVTHDTRMFHNAHEVSNDNGNDLRFDVHYCTSALCSICNRGVGAKFVSAVDDDDSSTIVVQEGHEFSLEDMYKRSFEYKPKEEASVPSYSNPAGIAARPYAVDDTVEL
ncbi:hypothetical protein ACHAXA_009080 [Cyclostephanos tholiformis]|uniref:Membrane-associated protein n=1 Tax=Cyclostephanos tholiformis TaxID=382380 RepID=A0ABD3SPX4_9STRA